MRVLRLFFNFYLDASIHVAFSVVALYFITVGLLDGSTNWSLVGFLFCSTIVCYNFIKYGVEAKKYIIVRSSYQKAIQFFSFLAFFATLFFFFKLDTKLWSAIVVFAFLSALYAVPFLPKAKNLRSLGGTKIYLVALVWTGCTLILEVLDSELGFTLNILVLSFQRFLLVIVLILPFDIRDLDHDGKELKTIPQRLGIVKTKMFGYILLILFFSLTFFKDGFTTLEVTYRCLASFLLGAGIFMTKKEQPKYFASFWIEAIPMVLLLILKLVIHVV